MLTPPRHWIPPLVYPGVRVRPISQICILFNSIYEIDHCSLFLPFMNSWGLKKDAVFPVTQQTLFLSPQPFFFFFGKKKKILEFRIFSDVDFVFVKCNHFRCRSAWPLPAPVRFLLSNLQNANTWTLKIYWIVWKTDECYLKCLDKKKNYLPNYPNFEEDVTGNNIFYQAWIMLYITEQGSTLRIICMLYQCC